MTVPMLLYFLNFKISKVAPFEQPAPHYLDTGQEFVKLSKVAPFGQPAPHYLDRGQGVRSAMAIDAQLTLIEKCLMVFQKERWLCTLKFWDSTTMVWTYRCCCQFVLDEHAKEEGCPLIVLNRRHLTEDLFVS